MWLSCLVIVYNRPSLCLYALASMALYLVYDKSTAVYIHKHIVQILVLFWNAWVYLTTLIIDPYSCMGFLV